MRNSKNKPKLTSRHQRRIRDARTAMAAFAKAQRVAPQTEGWDTVLRDLLANLIHFSHRSGIEFSEELRRAMDHYLAEADDPSAQAHKELDAVCRALAAARQPDSQSDATVECEGCGDTGIRLNQKGEIERCDACGKYPNDYEAWLAAKPGPTQPG